MKKYLFILLLLLILFIIFKSVSYNNKDFYNNVKHLVDKIFDKNDEVKILDLNLFNKIIIQIIENEIYFSCRHGSPRNTSHQTQGHGD